MNDPPHLLKPNRLSWGHSPTRHRVGDDILAHLTPAAAVEALGPTGALRGCLDGTTAPDREFALQTAVASRSVWGWVEELTEWNWPADGGPAGFESPDGTQRRFSLQLTAPGADDAVYMGSLLAEDVARYETRIEEIHWALERLNIEDLKHHVMTNHIMPLSRPGTPASISSRSGLSTTSAYNKMHDSSAVVTAIIVQALPNLARLSRLLQIWSVRIAVLQRIPRLTLEIEDAETALKSGWNAMSLQTRGAAEGETSPASTLTREDFEIMRKVLAKRVSKPGRALDYMLDCLEGLQDTLPNQWLDRMEAVERDYAEWVAACEHKVRATEWAVSVRAQHKELPSVDDNMVDPATEENLESNKNVHLTPENADSKGHVNVDLTEDKLESDRTFDPTENAEPNRHIHPTEEKPESIPVASQPEDLQKPVAHPAEEFNSEPNLKVDQSSHESNASESDGAVDAPLSSDETSPAGSVDDNESDSEMDTSTWSRQDEAPTFELTMSPVLEKDEPELPPLLGRSKGLSELQSPSLRGAAHPFDGLSSDPPEVSASPGLPRNRVREAQYVEESPPSSPPLPEDPQEPSTLLDSPVITSVPENDESFLNTEVDGSFADDFDDSYSIAEAANPVYQHESSSDQQLRQQISQIIESIPAKIKLSSETPAINLNPPDLQLPRLRKKPSKEPFKRSASSLSSRTNTPSFTLSPAKYSRPPRHQRGQQEIKVYHLSRSTGEPPIKLFIRCVGENGERVMVRVGGGWADLSEYLKEYATHHKRRTVATDSSRVEVRDVPRVTTSIAANSSVIIDSESSPRSRPGSAIGDNRPLTPLRMRKTRRSAGAANMEVPRLQPKTPAAGSRLAENAPSSEESTRSRSSSRLSWVEEDSSFLGLAGPSGKKVEMSDENKAWVESVKAKVRLASGERTVSEGKKPAVAAAAAAAEAKRFGELGKVGATKRLFRKKDDRREGNAK